MTFTLTMGSIYFHIFPHLLVSKSALGIAWFGIAFTVTQACAIGIATVETARNADTAQQLLRLAGKELDRMQQRVQSQGVVIENMRRELEALERCARHNLNRTQETQQ